MITDSWPTFSNGSSQIALALPTQPPSATEWPHYIATNWPQVAPQNAHRCQDTFRWRHNERDSVSNHQHHGYLLNRLFRRRSKKTSKLRVTGLYAGNSPGTGEFPAQMASNAENVSLWWRHHVSKICWPPSTSPWETICGNPRFAVFLSLNALSLKTQCWFDQSLLVKEDPNLKGF